MDSKIVQVALNGLENILRLGEQESKQNGMGINPYCALIEEAYGKKLLLVKLHTWTSLFQAVKTKPLWTILKFVGKFNKRTTSSINGH